MKDLIDKINEGETAQANDRAERDQQIRQLRLVMEQGEWLDTERLLVVLRQKIDHDLLFAEDADLSTPKIHEIVHEEWTKVFTRIRLVVRQDIQEGIIRASVKGVHVTICRTRPRYVGGESGTRELR